MFKTLAIACRWLELMRLLFIKINVTVTADRPDRQHTLVGIQLNIVTCPIYLEKFIRDDVIVTVSSKQSVRRCEIKSMRLKY